MAAHPLIPFLLLSAGVLSATVPSEGYYMPSANGGSQLTSIPITYPMGLGEPLNVIISGASDPVVLEDAEENGGMRNYWLSLGGFAGECLGQHEGEHQAANLGDGNRYQNETAVIRWDYHDPTLGTCKETVQGGNHFRYWRQDGKGANSGAYFLALSYELPIALGHDIIPNGYNLARDWMIGNITNSSIPTPQLTNSSMYSGTTSFNGYTYATSIKYVSGMLSNTSDGINHQFSVGVNGTNAVDGLVAVLDIQVTSKPPTSGAVLDKIPPRLAGLALLSFPFLFAVSL